MPLMQTFSLPDGVYGVALMDGRTLFYEAESYQDARQRAEEDGHEVSDATGGVYRNITVNMKGWRSRG